VFFSARSFKEKNELYLIKKEEDKNEKIFISSRSKLIYAGIIS